MGLLTGWVSLLDESPYWMGLLTGWVSLLDGPPYWVGLLTGWVSLLDESPYWMGLLTGWASLLDESPYWMGLFTGWVSLLDGPPYWMGLLTGWVSLLDGSPYWMGLFTGWVSLLDGSPYWMSLLTGWVSLLDGSPYWMDAEPCIGPDEARIMTSVHAILRIGTTLILATLLARAKGNVTPTSPTRCGGNFTAPSGGPITSPNYPDHYGNNENCEWLITVPAGNKILLTFDKGQYLEEDADFLFIYDGASDSALELQRSLSAVCPRGWECQWEDCLTARKTEVHALPMLKEPRELTGAGEATKEHAGRGSPPP
ncbi:CUB and sushi domain-containing protein 3 [Branchiostoma belcheri]|nr:CUB and sushi domain-containing protein 3 [Branchiostoma belcheri]